MADSDVDHGPGALKPRDVKVPGLLVYMQNPPTIRIGGQVSKIPYSPKGIDYRWYTGERPDAMPRF